MTKSDALLRELSQLVSTNDDHALATQHAPILRFDKNEPFLPLAVGYTVFRSPSKSPSSKFVIDPAGGIAIEYAIWWDWDIQHLYELEHVWVYLDAEQQLTKLEASAHGALLQMITEAGTIPLEDGRITIYSEPGKHGFAPERSWLISRSKRTNQACGEKAGNGGIHTSNPFGAATLGSPTALEHRLAKRYMQQFAFAPQYNFSQLFDLRNVPFVTWAQLEDWIPRRIKWWCSQLPQIVQHLQVICLDSGDTMVDESTEVKEGEVVLRADLIPDTLEMIDQLKAEGYTIALVADGPRATFENVLKHQHGFWEAFSTYAISEDVGVLKPDARMFQSALDALNIAPSDYSRVVMVGNNLARDIKGANDLNIISIWMNWSPRRSKTPADESEIPNYTIPNPSELVPLLEKIELSLSKGDMNI